MMMMMMMMMVFSAAFQKQLKTYLFSCAFHSEH